MKYDALLEHVIDEATRVAKLTLDATLHELTLDATLHDQGTQSWQDYHFVIQSEEKWQNMIKEIGIEFGGGGLMMDRTDISPWDQLNTSIIHRIGSLLHLGYAIDLGGELWVIEDEADAILFKLTWC